MDHPECGDSSPENPRARVALCGALCFLFAVVALGNLPLGPVQKVAKPLLTRLGLHQDWGLFSPNPVGYSHTLEARVHFEDGSEETATLPHGGPLVGGLRGYRWRKWASRIHETSRQYRWPGFARWVARRFAEDARGLRHVVLIRRQAATPPPGSKDSRTWEAFEFYRLTPLLPPAPRNE